MEDIEDTQFVALEHDRLISAISKLDKTQHITEPTRNEPTNINSEFSLLKRSNKLNLDNVAKILEKTAHHVQIGKKLKKTHLKSKVLNKPLEKPQAERIKRATGYEATQKTIGRWDPVVARSRTLDYVSFPLRSVTTKLQPTGEFLSKFKLKSDLERELEEVDPPPVEEVEEVEEQVFPMTYDEMVEHRQHIAKMRAQESYKAAKAKRQSKIKSKKYHRVLKKERLKQQLKEFEELQKKDPEEALKKLEALEKGRALERHTLRHKNTGKWAKNQLIRAKYDKEVRQQIAEQLAVSRNLTKKVQDTQSSDDEADNDNTPDLSLAQDPLNPWMMKRTDKSNFNTEFDFGYKKYVQNKKKLIDDSDTDSNDENTKEVGDELSALKSSIAKLIKTKVDENKPVATSNWVVEISQNVGKLEQTSSRSKNKKGKQKLTENTEVDNLEYLKFKKRNIKAIVDEKLIETASKAPEEKSNNDNGVEKLAKILRTADTTQESSSSNIDPTRFIEVKPKYLNTAISQVENEYDQLDDDEQVVPKVNIEEVFEEDDVVASFRQEKDDEMNKDKMEEINLSLPGWGSWGGKGVKPQKRKRNRFISKPAPKMPRRDENKGDIIIREYKDPKLAIHKVKDVPFPFESIKDYEASIRAPLGNTFIPERAHKRLIRPSVITKAGTIIEPMNEEELLVPKNRIFRNEAVIKLLGQK